MAGVEPAGGIINMVRWWSPAEAAVLASRSAIDVAVAGATGRDGGPRRCGIKVPGDAPVDGVRVYVAARVGRGMVRGGCTLDAVWGGGSGSGGGGRDGGGFRGRRRRQRRIRNRPRKPVLGEEFPHDGAGGVGDGEASGVGK